MSTEITMPALSPTMTHGNLTRWAVIEGDTVKAGDIIAELETDKTVMELESPETGIIGRLLYANGSENIAVGAVIAVICNSAEEVVSLVAALDTPEKEERTDFITVPKTSAQTPSTATAVDQDGRLRASPLAKMLAAKINIDLRMLTGSGPGGRIIKRDVLAAEQNTGPLPPSTDSASYTEIPMSRMQRTIAKRLQYAKQTVPHYYLSVNIELDRLIAIRKELNESIAPNRVSMNDFIVKACALSLRDFPVVNSQFADDTIRQYSSVDIAIAVALDSGLVTPVLRNADSLSLRNTAVQIGGLAARARDGKLLPEDYQGGTFTLSNLGMYGVKSFGAIINPPQAAILAVGAGEGRPVVKSDELVVATVLTATLSCDHRVINGKEGAEFLSNIKKLLENPLPMLP